MAIVQTYESHLVGIGEPLSGRSDGSDTIKFLAFAQGLSYQYQKDIKRFKQIGKDDFYFNRQTDWADVSVDITQFDSIDDNYDILKNLNIFPSSEEFTSGTYYPFLRNIITGGRNSNGSPIYFITDTGERARDVLGNDDSISRDFTVIDPCYLSSVSWSVAKNTVASFEYSFVGNYMRTGSYTENGDIVWDHIINTGNGDSYISTTGDGDVSSTSNEIDVNNVSGLFIGGYTNVSGAPDLGEIRGISWSVSIDRSNVQGLGNPMKYDRKISPEHIGQLTIEYNYEGQEFDLANVADIPYNIRIESKNKNNFFRIFKIENALIESAQLNSSTSGEPDSYSVTFSFKINKNGGLLYDIQQSESGSTSSDDYTEPSNVDSRLIFTIDTTKAQFTSNTEFKIATLLSYTYNCEVDWGDGSTNTINTYDDTNWSHTYSSPGQYQIKISGKFGGFYSFFSLSFREKLISIDNWGDTGIEGFNDAFYQCYQLISVNDIIPYNSITDFSDCFRECIRLQSIPSGLFSNCNSAINFNDCFRECRNLQSIPSGLFSNCTSAVNFNNCFRECINLQSIPSGLFSNCNSAVNFSYCFHVCRNLQSIASDLFEDTIGEDFSSCFANISLNLSIDINFVFPSTSKNFNNCFTSASTIDIFDPKDIELSISSDLFKNCTLATNFGSCFLFCSSLKTINNNFFKNCISAESFERCFYGCSSLESIGSGLFLNCTSATNFFLCFYDCSSLSALNSDLFSTCTSATNFGLCFFGCSSLESIPSELFSNCTSATNFYACFYQCNKISSIPSNLFGNTIGTDFSFAFAFCNLLTSTANNIFPNTASNFSQCFEGVTLNTTDYSNLLVYIESTNSNNNVVFHGGNSKYNTSAATARSNLQTDHNWVITDGGAA